MIYITILLSYLLGSIPVGYLIAKALKGIDVRRFGSGNIGATNVARVVSKGAGIVTLILDILKGLAAVTLVPLLAGGVRPDLVRILCALAVVAGHNWTVFLKFRGGKGVATTAGALIGLAPLVFISALCVWIIMFVISKYVSLASIVAGVSMPVFFVFYGEPMSFFVLGVIIALIGIFRHKENIKRLLAGKENKLALWGK